MTSAPTKAQIEAACAALEQGHAPYRAAAMAGVSKAQWNTWDMNAEGATLGNLGLFRRRVEEATLKGVRALVAEENDCWSVAKAIVADTTKDDRVRMEAAAFLLKHRHGVYAAKAPPQPQKVEHSGPDGGPVQTEAISPALDDMLRRMTPEQLVAVAQGSQDEVT